MRAQTRIVLTCWLVGFVALWTVACADSRPPLVRVESVPICPPMLEMPTLPERNDDTVGSLVEAWQMAIEQIGKAQAQVREQERFLMGRCT